MSRVCVGVVGCGMVAQAEHLPNLLQLSERFEISALADPSATVREAMGYGRQKNRLHRYLGSEYNASFLPKVELTLFVREQDAAAAVKAIVGQARTGRMGDGKIVITPCLGDFVSW